MKADENLRAHNLPFLVGIKLPILEMLSLIKEVYTIGNDLVTNYTLVL